MNPLRHLGKKTQGGLGQQKMDVIVAFMQPGEHQFVPSTYSSNPHKLW
jgi:hypothetical protein